MGEIIKKSKPTEFRSPHHLASNYFNNALTSVNKECVISGILYAGGSFWTNYSAVPSTYEHSNFDISPFEL